MEDTTAIDQLTLLSFSYFLSLIVTPFLILATGLLLGVAIYWDTTLQTIFFYTKTKKLEEATHILVEGRLKNLEIVKLKHEDEKHSFEYQLN